MARWDEILSLPVQNPPTMEFAACDLEWSIIRGQGDNLDRIAFIPYPRVGDFIRGESNNKDCPTRFKREASRPNVPKQARIDSTIESVM